MRGIFRTENCYPTIPVPRFPKGDPCNDRTLFAFPKFHRHVMTKREYILHLYFISRLYMDICNIVSVIKKKKRVLRSELLFTNCDREKITHGGVLLCRCSSHSSPENFIRFVVMTVCTKLGGESSCLRIYWLQVAQLVRYNGIANSITDTTIHESN